jgi:hypothetical protein
VSQLDHAEILVSTGNSPLAGSSPKRRRAGSVLRWRQHFERFERFERMRFERRAPTPTGNVSSPIFANA